MTARAYSYIRFSTPEQIEGDSLRRQLELSEQWAAAHGLELDSSHRDLGRSGYTGEHRTKGHLGRFMRAVEQGTIPSGSYLLVENCDRLSREEPLEAFDIFRRIIQAGIIVVTTDDGQVYSRESLAVNPVQMMMWIMSTIRGNAESARKSATLGRAWEQKRKDAREVGKAMTAACPRWLRKVGDQYEVIPERGDLVRRIFCELESGIFVSSLFNFDV